MSSNIPLFTPLRVGAVNVSHRVALAPLTRYRANAAHEHQDGVASTYYGQRASTPGTLLITEATFVSAQAGGYDYVPGIWSSKQTEAWKKVVDEVHSKGSILAMQLWNLGRAAKASTLEKDGLHVLAPSAVALKGGSQPREMTVNDIKAAIADYAQGAKNFVEGAGGDLVELHGANGYLIDQFLQTSSNKRTDSYGGSVENRVRFGLEAVKAVVAAVGAERVGIRLSPYSPFQEMKMDMGDIKETFSLFVTELKKAHPNLAYLHVTESRVAGNIDVKPDERETLDFLYDIWGSAPVLVAGGFTAETAYKLAKERDNVVVVFGRYFISNPDLVHRIKNDIPFTPYNRDLFYSTPGSTDPHGYTDYPSAVKAKA